MVATYIQGPDPNWSYQRNDRITNALNTLLSMKERRAKEREKQFLLALKAMEMNPQSALTPMADDLMAQYGDQPGAYAMIQAVKGRALDVQKRQEDVQQFLGNKQTEELEDAAWRENYMDQIRKDPAWMRDAMGQERPDMVGPPSQQDIATDRFQNTLGFSFAEKQRPSAGYRALADMSPEAQLNAIAGMKEYGMTPPVAPSAMGGFDIPKEIQALAMAAGPQAAYDAWMRQNGALPSAGAQLQADTTRAGWEHADAALQEEERLRRERMRLQRDLDIDVKTTPPGKNASESGGKGVDETLTTLQKKAAATVKKEKDKAVVYSEGAAAEVAKILGENTSNGVYMGTKAASMWKQLVERSKTDENFAQTLKLRGETIEDAWILWAQGFAAGKYK